MAVYPDLATLLAARNDPILAGVGLEIFHDPVEEGPSTRRARFVQRRNYVYRCAAPALPAESDPGRRSAPLPFDAIPAAL